MRNITPFIFLTALSLANCGGGGDGGEPGATNPFANNANSGSPAPNDAAPASEAETAGPPTDNSASGEPTQPADQSAGSGSSGTNTAVPVDDSSYLLFTDGRSRLLRLPLRTGVAGTLFDLGISDNFRGYPDVMDGVVYINASDNTLNAIDFDSGRLLWDVTLGNYDSIDTSYPASPVCGQGMCYTIGNGGLLVAVDVGSAAGGASVRWELPLHPNGGIEQDLSVNALLVTDNHVITATYSNGSDFGDPYVGSRLHRINRQTGELEQVYILESGFSSSVHLADNRLMVPTQGGLLALDARTFQQHWVAEVFGAGTPVVVAGVVVVHAYSSDGNGSQRIIGIDATSGAVLWNIDGGTDSTRLFTPNTDGVRIYTIYAVSSNSFAFNDLDDGVPIALNPADGALVWAGKDLFSARHSPVVGNAGLFFGALADYDADVEGGYRVRQLSPANGATERSMTRQTLGFSPPTLVTGNRVARHNNVPTIMDKR